MDVFIYQASLLCSECGWKKRIELEEAGKAPADMDDENTYDSDDFPKGPYDDGGGASDTPEHCDSCKVFLENPLTEEGMEYAEKIVHEAYEKRPSNAGFSLSYKETSVALSEWADFYDIKPPWYEKEYKSIKLENSDDDPLQIIATITGPHADDFAEAQGSLDGGTWERDGGDGMFVYDVLYWRPGLIDELEKEGYKLDRTEYSEPDEDEIAEAKRKREEE